MLAHIIRREVQYNLTSSKFVFTFLLCTILILVSIYIGTVSYQSDLREYNLAVALDKQLQQSFPSWGALGANDGHALRPPEILSTIAVGIQDAVGRNATVDMSSNPKPRDSRYDSNPVFAIFGPLDLTLIVKMVLSLFAILFTFDAISGEKEMGTLKLALSNQVPRDQLILGKTIGGFVSLVLPLAMPFLMGLILLSIFLANSLTGEDWVRMGLIFVCFLLYLSVFLNLGLLVSARTSRSSSSLFILLFIWVVSIFVVPKVSVMISRQLMPLPASHIINSEKRAFHMATREKSGRQLQDWVKADPWPQGQPGPELDHRRNDWEQRYKDYYAQWYKDADAIIYGRFAELDADHRRRRHRQQSLALSLSRVSPASAMTLGVLSLAKTGVAEHERFLSSVRAYLPAIGNWLIEKSTQDMQFGPNAKPVKPNLEGLPVYEFIPQKLGDSLQQALTDIILLVLMNAVLFAGSYVSFLKYDVR